MTIAMAMNGACQAEFERGVQAVRSRTVDNSYEVREALQRAVTQKAVAFVLEWRKMRRIG
jgi:hypothetical protein